MLRGHKISFLPPALAMCLSRPWPARTFPLKLVVVTFLYPHGTKQGSSTFVRRHHGGTCWDPKTHLLISLFAQHSQIKVKHQPFSLALLKINLSENHNDSIGLSFSELLISVVPGTKWMVPDQTCRSCWYLRLFSSLNLYRFKSCATVTTH